jgi:large subunit ribosomal protein L35
MPKIKTNKSAKKRFSFTGSGKKIKRTRAGKRHLLSVKNRNRKRSLRQAETINASDYRRTERMLPNG